MYNPFSPHLYNHWAILCMLINLLLIKAIEIFCITIFLFFTKGKGKQYPAPDKESFTQIVSKYLFCIYYFMLTYVLYTFLKLAHLGWHNVSVTDHKHSFCSVIKTVTYSINLNIADKRKYNVNKTKRFKLCWLTKSMSMLSLFFFNCSFFCQFKYICTFNLQR